MRVSLKSIGQQIKILERLKHISDGLTDDRRTDGRPTFPYLPLHFAGAGDNKASSSQLSKKKCENGGHF
jgi:hypothetical protein